MNKNIKILLATALVGTTTFGMIACGESSENEAKVVSDTKVEETIQESVEIEADENVTNKEVIKEDTDKEISETQVDKEEKPEVEKPEAEVEKPEVEKPEIEEEKPEEEKPEIEKPEEEKPAPEIEKPKPEPEKPEPEIEKPAPIISYTGYKADSTASYFENYTINVPEGRELTAQFVIDNLDKSIGVSRGTKVLGFEITEYNTGILNLSRAMYGNTGSSSTTGMFRTQGLLKTFKSAFKIDNLILQVEGEGYSDGHYEFGPFDPIS
ncbi:hypothetical protein [uncultured Clostridium sp.]|jgi:DNA polymerase III alpha subunit (gram-positive type)|uniref:hypothetical protein n=1 Tax=uncultured Clostridium sp. TaxID=59620 RepID=UPI00261973D7|nr:hypothetical protein [uncultured Clostridium sp.]